MISLNYFKSYIMALDLKTHSSYNNHINNACEKFRNNRDDVKSDNKLILFNV